MKKLFITRKKNLNKKFTTRGFTLIESALYVGISSIMLLAISFFLFTLLESRVKNQTIAEVSQQGIQIMQILTQTIGNADIINYPLSGTSAEYLSLNTYTASNNPTIFDLSGGIIRIKEGIGSNIPLTNSRVNMSNLSFSNLSLENTPGSIRISFTLNYVNQEGRNEYNFSKNFYASASLRQP